MYVVVNRIEVEPERAEVFEQHFGANMTGTLPGVPGLRRAVLLRPRRPSDPYLAVMEFDSEDDFTAWRNSEAFRTAHGGRPAGGSGESGPPVEAYEVVAAVSG
jgi:heme-degrading monooxygenase HmoA